MGVVKKKEKKPVAGDDRVIYYHTKYQKYSRAIGVMWAILVVCFLIITLVCFIQPTWLGADRDAPGAGYFGLWKYYRFDGISRNQRVEYGEFLDFDQIPSQAFRAATAFVGLTVLLTIICVLCLFLFICISAHIVFLICGWILVVDALFLLLACVIYPAGWDVDEVASVCASSAYESNKCYILWAYILAIVAIFDAIVLAVLAFVLAYKRVRLLPWQEKPKEVKKAYIVEDDRASGVQYVQTVQPQPVILVDQRSERSQPIGTLKSHKSSKHHFNL